MGQHLEPWSFDLVGGSTRGVRLELTRSAPVAIPLGRGGGADRAMIARSMPCHGYVGHLISASSTWKAVKMDEFTAEKVVLRHSHYAMVQFRAANGCVLIKKIATHVLPYLKTKTACTLYTWTKGGCYQSGLRRVNEEQVNPDLFLTADEPDVPAGFADPDYKPLEEHPEPWAVEHFRYDQLAGYGYMMDDDAMSEPWSCQYTNLAVLIENECSGECQHEVGSPPDATYGCDTYAPGGTIGVTPEGFEPWAQQFESRMPLTSGSPEADIDLMPEWFGMHGRCEKQPIMSSTDHSNVPLGSGHDELHHGIIASCFDGILQWMWSLKKVTSSPRQGSSCPWVQSSDSPIWHEDAHAMSNGNTIWSACLDMPMSMFVDWPGCVVVTTRDVPIPPRSTSGDIEYMLSLLQGQHQGYVFELPPIVLPTDTSGSFVVTEHSLELCDLESSCACANSQHLNSESACIDVMSDTVQEICYVMNHGPPGCVVLTIRDAFIPPRLVWGDMTDITLVDHPSEVDDHEEKTQLDTVGMRTHLLVSAILQCSQHENDAYRTLRGVIQLCDLSCGYCIHEVQVTYDQPSRMCILIHARKIHCLYLQDGMHTPKAKQWDLVRVGVGHAPNHAVRSCSPKVALSLMGSDFKMLIYLNIDKSTNVDQLLKGPLPFSQFFGPQNVLFQILLTHGLFASGDDCHQHHLTARLDQCANHISLSSIRMVGLSYRDVHLLVQVKSMLEQFVQDQPLPKSKVDWDEAKGEFSVLVTISQKSILGQVLSQQDIYPDFACIDDSITTWAPRQRAFSAHLESSQQPQAVLDFLQVQPVVRQDVGCSSRRNQLLLDIAQSSDGFDVDTTYSGAVPVRTSSSANPVPQQRHQAGSDVFSHSSRSFCCGSHTVICCLHFPCLSGLFWKSVATTRCGTTPVRPSSSGLHDPTPRYSTRSEDLAGKTMTSDQRNHTWGHYENLYRSCEMIWQTLKTICSGAVPVYTTTPGSEAQARQPEINDIARMGIVSRTFSGLRSSMSRVGRPGGPSTKSDGKWRSSWCLPTSECCDDNCQLCGTLLQTNRNLSSGAVPVDSSTPNHCALNPHSGQQYARHAQTINSGAVPSSTSSVWTFGFPISTAMLAKPLRTTVMSNINIGEGKWRTFCSFGRQRETDRPNAVFIGGHPAWDQSEVIHMQTDVSLHERLAATSRDNGWLASDEMHFCLQLIRQRRDDVHVSPVIHWCPDRDLMTNVEGSIELYITNRQLTVMPFLIKSHWCALEIDKRSFPPHVLLVQWPDHLVTRILHKIAQAIQIPPHRMTSHVHRQDQSISMCGWTLLHKWQQDFGLDHLLHLQSANPTTHHDIIIQALQRSQRFWNRTNAGQALRDFASQVRMGFLIQYALGNPDTRVPATSAMISFAGVTDDYVRRSCLLPHAVTQADYEQEINTTLAQSPAWMSSVEIELCLRGIRPRDSERLFPSPMRFQLDTQTLNCYDDYAFSAVGFDQVTLIVLFHQHWVMVTLARAQSRWCAFIAIHDPRHRDLPSLHLAISQLLEIPQVRLDSIIMPTQAFDNMCGWTILFNLCQKYDLLPQASVEFYERRISYMPGAQVKLTILELGKAEWLRCCPDHALRNFAAITRARLLAFCEGWRIGERVWIGGHPGQTAWGQLSATAKQNILTSIRAHCQQSQICPCMTKITAYIELGEMVFRDDHVVHIHATIKPTPFTQDSTFQGERLNMHTCPYAKSQDICLVMPMRYQDTIQPGMCAVVIQGGVSMQGSKYIVRIGDLESGLQVFREGLEVESKHIVIGEYCSGAFSGWTQAGMILERMGFATETRYAVDNDACVATCYADNYMGGNKATCPADIFRLRDECFFYKGAQIVFQSDIRLGWWLFFSDSIQVATASPPCPAFSAAGTSGGLERLEGLTIIETILKIMVARPKILLIEEVATLKSHPHYGIVQSLLQWGGYTIVWEQVINLNEILPQSRPRLLIVAKRDDAIGLQVFQCQSWGPQLSAPTLAAAHCLLEDSEILHQTCPDLTGRLLHDYLDPVRIPGGPCRSRADAIRFRLKSADDQCHCILASYGFGHEYQSTRNEVNVIFGTLLKHQGQVRFLATPEIAFLQGVSVPWEGPLEIRMATHFLGNAISVPHALLAMLNGLCHFVHLAHTDFPCQLFDIAMQNRLHAKNSCVTIDCSRKRFRIDTLSVTPTQPWSEQVTKLTHVYLLQGKQTVEIWVQQQIRVLDAFRCLFRNYTVSCIEWLPFHDYHVALPIQEHDIIAGETMRFVLPADFQLCLDEQMFSQEAQEYILTLMSEQMILFRCQPHDTVQTHINRVAGHLDKPVQLYDHMLQTADLDSRPRQVVIIGDPQMGCIIKRPDIPGVLLDIGESLQCRMPMSSAFQFVQACQTNGTSHVLSALGWQVLLRLESRPESTEARVVILPALSQLHVDVIAIRNILASHLTTWLLPVSLPTSSSTFSATLKLWSTVVWKGNLSRDWPVETFARAWQEASRFTGPCIPVHTIWRGRRLTPGFVLQDYISPQVPHDEVQRFHIVGHLTGGGSKVDHAIQVNKQLVTFLLQCGASSITTPKFAAELIQYAGLTRVQQILAVPDEELCLEQVKQTAMHYKVHMPEFADLEHERTKKLRANTRKWKPANIEPKAAQFRLSESLFQTQDGKFLSSGDVSSPGEGVFLLDSSDMQSFLNVNNNKYTHCVAVCLGTRCPIADATCSVHNLPAIDQKDHKVVVATCVHQLGSQKAKLLGSDADDLPSNATTVLALTAWRDEMDDNMWQQILEAPLRTMWKNFNIEPSNTIIPRPWGRSWRDGMRVTDQEHASSFQVHARVYSTAVLTLLAQSGKNGMFITPKGVHGNAVDSSYAIVWMKDKTCAEVIAVAESIDGHAGVVRSFRGKQAYGVRVPSNLYESTMSTLHPDGPKQAHVPANYFGKLSPLPHGTGFDEIKTWLTTQSLKMRPIRALSSTVWLLAAPDPIDTSHYLWGRNSVLLEQIDSKRQAQPTVVAGARKVVHLADHVTPSDVLQVSDPWANFSPLFLTVGSSSSSSTRTALPSTPISEGTASQKSTLPACHKDDHELQDIKKQIEILARESKEHMQTEKQLQKDFNSQIQQVRQEVKAQFESTEQSFRQTLDTRIHHLEQSITKTQSDLQLGFKEVLSRLAKPDHADSDSSKRKKHGDDAMQVES